MKDQYVAVPRCLDLVHFRGLYLGLTQNTQTSISSKKSGKTGLNPKTSGVNLALTPGTEEHLHSVALKLVTPASSPYAKLDGYHCTVTQCSSSCNILSD